jgi:hypothetical protein
VKELLPREHGAYGQLAFPALSGLILTGAKLPGVALTAAAVAAFLTHEPLLVVLGLRGTRAKRELGERAGRMLVLLVFVVASLVALAWLTALAPIAAPLGVSAVLGAGVFFFVLRRQERTAAGEILAAGALASTAIPVMAAGGAGVTAGVWVWLTWTLTSAVVILPIRALVARRNKTLSRIAAAAAAVAVLVALLVLPGLHVPLVRSGWPVVPACVFALALCTLAPSPRWMRTVGWSAIAVSVLTTGALVATF